MNGSATFYHSYIIHTTSSGERFIVRASPNGVGGNAFTDDIKVVGVDSPLEYNSNTHSLHNDWPNEGSAHYSSVIAAGSGSALQVLGMRGGDPLVSGCVSYT